MIIGQFTITKDNNTKFVLLNADLLCCTFVKTEKAHMDLMYFMSPVPSVDLLITSNFDAFDILSKKLLLMILGDPGEEIYSNP